LKRLSNGLNPKQNENGDLEAALQLKAQMEQAGFKPDECTYHLLMTEHCSAERLGDVTALFLEMLIQGTTLHKIVHSSLLEFLCRINEDQLLGIIEESAKNGVSAADNGCITLLKELCRIDKVSSAEKVLQTFAKAGLVPTTEMYNILIVSPRLGNSKGHSCCIAR
jgi:pentatricopeptide repeat protein